MCATFIAKNTLNCRKSEIWFWLKTFIFRVVSEYIIICAKLMFFSWSCGKYQKQSYWNILWKSFHQKFWKLFGKTSSMKGEGHFYVKLNFITDVWFEDVKFSLNFQDIFSESFWQISFVMLLILLCNI